MFDSRYLDVRALEENWLTLEQFGATCKVEPEWLRYQIEKGMFPGIECVANKWRVVGDVVARARLMRQLERDFGAAPNFFVPEDEALDEMTSLRPAMFAVGTE